MVATNRLGFVLGLALSLSLASAALAQAADPFAGGDDDLAAPSGEPAKEPASEPAPEAAEPAAPAAPAAEAAAPAEPADAEASGSVDLSVAGSGANVDASANADAGAPPAAPPSSAPVQKIAASHIARPMYKVDGATILDTPLRTDLQGKEYLLMRRQLDGVALPDTTAALGLGGAGTSRLELRLQPTLVLLNGRRLVSAPAFGPNGADIIDINQLPIQLIGRVEQTSGLAAGLWGAGAMGGVANFVTRRDITGVDIELGGQSTSSFDQGDFDVAVTLGMVDDDGGGNLMLSYFNRQPLAASDRDWIGERQGRTQTLTGAPANYQKLINGDYPISDPYCDRAAAAGYATGYEVRLRGYGAVSNIDQLAMAKHDRLLMFTDGTRGPNDPATRDNGVIDPLESSTYCGVDYTGSNDLILKDERIQSYGTLWQNISKHTEVFAEAGYYRTENSNRTAPSFPVTRLTPSAVDIEPLVVPAQHADNPNEAYGFTGAEGDPLRTPSSLFFIGRTQGTWNGDGVNQRRADVMRGVLGLRGDLAGLAQTGPVSTWGWELSGTFSRSDQVSRVKDTLMDALTDALAACDATRLNPATNMEEPTTIKQRQEAGCFSPFFSSVINNAAVDPLNVSSQTAANVDGFITGDSDAAGDFGSGVQDGGYICDPNDPMAPPCPASFNTDDDPTTFELAGTPNTKQVIDRITGEHFEVQQRTLATVGADVGGDLATFGTSALAFDVGAEYRRESLYVDYDQAYEQRQYGFLFGADDIDPVSRDMFGANVELRLRLSNGLLELQPAAKIEMYETVGMGLNAQLGAFVRPFANAGEGPLEWLGLRVHAGRGQQPPSLIQLYGAQNDFVQVDFRGATQFIAHQVSGNPKLDFENYTTIGGGPQWDWSGIHVGADFWMTFIGDMIGYDNSRTLTTDCEEGFAEQSIRCPELIMLTGFDLLDHLESRFDNIGDVDTNGADGTISYTLDTKRRGMGDLGTFVLAVQGTFINSYLIKSPRAIAPYYRAGAPAVVPDMAGAPEYVGPELRMDGSRDYSGISAEYEAAGFRNYENFAPPIPKLRFSVPLRWMYSGHTLGATLRFIDGYYDDSEYTIEKQNLPGVDSLQFANGEKIPAWFALDALYGFSFDGDGWKGGFTVGVLNLLDEPPPAVESPLGYEVGVHDPRGRALYARLTGDF